MRENILFEKDMIIGNAYETFDLTEDSYTPSSFKLLPAYPNPFNPSTNITYSIPESQIVKLSIYDIMGREVEMLENTYKENGTYTIIWDAVGFASGIYYVKLASGNLLETQKVMLIK